MQSNNSLEKIESIDNKFLDKIFSTVDSNFQNIDFNLIKKNNFSDRTFINRLDDEKTIKTDENFITLLESIKNIDLLNPIYLLERNNNYISNNIELYRVAFNLSESRVREIKKEVLSELGTKIIAKNITLEEINQSISKKLN